MARVYQINCFVISLFLLLCSLTISEGFHYAWFQHKPETISTAQDWLNHGGDIYNRRYASNEHKINLTTISNLSLKWKFYAGKDITSTPSIFNGTIYFPSWNGFIFAVNEIDGSLVWKKNLTQLTGLKPSGFVTNANWTLARATPTIAYDEDLVIVGIYGPAVVVALNRSNGELIWQTRLDDNDAGVVTMSGTYYRGAYYVGSSSLEELKGIEECCTFRGSFSKLDIKTGAILWQTFTLPDNKGKRGEYSGGALWGSSPSIDSSRNHIYIATGNLYSAPLRITECQEKQNNLTIPTHLDECIEEENHANSILALDLDNGEIKWFHQFGGYDVWFLACNNLSVANCPPGPNPDADFGEAPMMLTIKDVNGTKQDVVVAVQKSGFAWSLERDFGNLIWSTEAGPGGIAGGGTWGAATDTKTVYTNIVNSNGKNFTLKPSNKTTKTGGWVALEAKSGKILWSLENPSNATTNGPVSVANGIVFAGSTNVNGTIYAINGKNGEILWSYESGSTIYGGVSISNGCIYFGNGYTLGLATVIGGLTGGTSLYAFCV